MRPSPSLSFGPSSLAPDCENCASLCCVALHIEKSTKFAIEKPAGTACPNLADNGLCTIHNTLKDSGFSGCVAYDCLGAGQRVIQDLYNGISWQQDPRLLAQMSDDFAKMREIHTMLELLSVSQKLPLTPDQTQTRTGLIARLFPTNGWTRESFDALEILQERKGVSRFLAELKPLLAP